MKITFQLIRLSERFARLQWTGTAGAYVSVFAAGARLYGPRRIDTASKSLDLPMPSAGAVEVHECETGTESVAPLYSSPAFRPTIAWPAVPGATEYQVLVDGVVVAQVPANGSRTWQAVITAADLRTDGGGWRTFAVSATVGTSTVTALASHFRRCEGPGTEPVAVDVDGVAPDIGVLVI